MRARSLFAGLLIALLVGSAFLFWRNFSDRNPRIIRESAQGIAQAQRGLARFGANAPDTPPDESVPADAFKLLATEKQHARELIRAVLNAEPPNASSEQLRSAAVQALTGANVTTADTSSESPKQLYGLMDVQIERVLGQRNLVAAKVRTSIPCGADSALYIYEREGSIWSPVLSYEAPEFNNIKGAYGALDYAISPATDGNWYALVASDTPSCASNWQGLRYLVLRKGPDAEHPKAVLNVSSGIYKGWDELWKLRADTDAAQISWPFHFNLDGTILIRAHVARYKIEADKATRIPPVAFYPEDFFDEWAERPWDESKEWVASETLTEAEAVHKWLHGSEIAGTITFIQSCPIPDHWQIGLTLDDTATQKPPMKNLFVDVSRDGDVFRLDRIAADRAPGCPGDDLPPQRQQSLP